MRTSNPAPAVLGGTCVLPIVSVKPVAVRDALAEATAVVAFVTDASVVLLGKAAPPDGVPPVPWTSAPMSAAPKLAVAEVMVLVLLVTTPSVTVRAETQSGWIDRHSPSSLVPPHCGVPNRVATME